MNARSLIAVWAALLAAAAICLPSTDAFAKRGRGSDDPIPHSHSGSHERHRGSDDHGRRNGWDDHGGRRGRDDHRGRGELEQVRPNIFISPGHDGRLDDSGRGRGRGRGWDD